MSEVEMPKIKSKKVADTVADTLASLRAKVAADRVAEPMGNFPNEEQATLAPSMAVDSGVTLTESAEASEVTAGATPLVPIVLPSEEPTGQPLKLRVDLLDDSAYQYRRVYDNESIDLLATSIELNGQVTPIRVRKKSDGRFEIISGHRRKRAAISRGWEYLEGIVVDVTDLQVASEVIAANEQEDTGDYERACGYRKLQDLGLKQVQIADRVGINKSLVSARLKFLDLPPLVIDVLNIHPRAINYHSVAPIIDILEKDPDMISDVVEGIKLVASGEWKAGSLVTILKKRMAGEEFPVKDTGYLAISDAESRPILTMRKMAKGKVEIQLEKGVDQEMFIKHLSHMLREEAAKDASLMGGSFSEAATHAP